MTPDRRLDQLESLMADSLQKIDRLIEGQGQLTAIATRADQKADITAKGVADLTLQTQQAFAEVRQNFTGVAQNFAQIDQNFTEVHQDITEIRQDIIQVDAKVGRVDEKVDRVDGKVDRVNEKVDSLRAEMNQRFDQLITLIQERLS